MSDAVVFLAGAAAFAVVGSLVVWLVARLRRPRQPDFLDQLSALAPPPRRRRVAEVDAVLLQRRAHRQRHHGRRKHVRIPDRLGNNQ